MTNSDSAVHPADPDQSVPGRKVLGYCLAIISVAAAVIHFAVAGEHFQEYWLFGVFMLVVAWLQLTWAVAIVTRPAPWLLGGGAIVNAGVVVIYILTRTVGDMVGPTPHDVEPFGFGDGLCTVLEAIIVAGCCYLLVSKKEFRLPREHLLAAPGATAGAVVVLLSIALVAGGPEMVMSASSDTPDSPVTSSATAGSGSGMQMSGTGGTAASVASVSLPTGTPGGNITMPSANMQMMPGMKMASSVACTAAPTTAQQQAAVNLAKTSWRGAEKFRSLSAAQAAGYFPITPTGAPVVHYLNLKYYIDTLKGGPILDTTQPQSLVYANTPKGAVLAAAMYISPEGDGTPQPGGCLTQWHVHTNLCTSSLGVVTGVIDADNATCPAGSSHHVTPPMMHVWFIPIPGGPTAIDAPDAQVVRAAEQVGSGGNKNGPA
jgi:hypothetical protein